MGNEGVYLAMWDELEKISEESTTDRVLKAAPGVGAVAGGVWGVASPTAFNPASLFTGLKDKVHGIKGRGASAVLGAGLGATTTWIPSALRDSKRAVMNPDGKGLKKKAEVIEGDDGSPVAKIIGSSVKKINDQRAKGVPIVEPPPGFTYNPELAAFVPNSEDPGWMTNPEAMQAQETQAAHQAGAQQQAQQGAQQEAETQAAQQVQQAQMQQQAEQGAQPQQAQQGAAPQVPQPGQITGLHPMAQPDTQKQHAGKTPKVDKHRPNSTNSVAR
jgi:hypothetical protein